MPDRGKRLASGFSCLLGRFVQWIGTDENFLGSLRPLAANHIEITPVPKSQELHALIIVQSELDSGHSSVIVQSRQMPLDGVSCLLEELIKPFALSIDNPYSESLFRTLKYCPQWPQDGFSSLEDARIWVRNFMTWYNTVHRHSRIRFVTPSQRHDGEDKEILSRRNEIYERARTKRPERWSGGTRNWNPIGTVYLNPGRELTVAVKVA